MAESSMVYPVMLAEMGEFAKLIMVFDAVIEEQHEQVCEVTEHPVEDGSVISDFVVQKPLTLSLSIIKSNYPIRYFNESRFSTIDMTQFQNIGQAFAYVAGSSNSPAVTQANKTVTGAKYAGNRSAEESTPPDYALRAYETISQIQKQAKALRVYTGIRIYDNMVIESISTKRNIGNAESWEATLQLKEVRSVSAVYVSTSNLSNLASADTKVRNSKKKDKGVAQTKPVGNEVEYNAALKYDEWYIDSLVKDYAGASPRVEKKRWDRDLAVESFF